jgi:hypothetical protein
MNMKNSILKLLVLAAVATILMSSCKKEVIYPTDQLPANVPKLNDFGGVSRWGEFLLIGSRKMVTNTATGAKTYYNDFGSSSRSSLRWGGSIYDIETIIKDTTTWSFWEPIGGSDGKFVLNNDTTHFYLVHYTTSYTSIIEDPNHGQSNMGGSARPISGETTDLANKIIRVYIQTAYTTLNGDACEYFTELTFKKTQEW